MTSGSQTDASGPEVLLAKPWPVDLDPTGYWMSEKLDGVRAYWDGSKFWSRLGGTFDAPEWFTRGLPPDAHLDGELFGGRGRFQETVSIVRTQRNSKKYDESRWHAIEFVVFDAPGYAATFESRSAIAEIAVRICDNARMLNQSRCKSVEHLRAELARVEGLGGEGLMLRRSGSMYERKRSLTLLKVKTFHDAEAIVVAHEPGKGKHAGRLGALRCRMVPSPDGLQSPIAAYEKLFSIGTGFSDAERESPPAVGSTVTYRYQELTNDGLPRFPSFVRPRPDGL